MNMKWYAGWKPTKNNIKDGGRRNWKPVVLPAIAGGQKRDHPVEKV